MTNITEITSVIERVEGGSTGPYIDDAALLATGHTFESCGGGVLKATIVQFDGRDVTKHEVSTDLTAVHDLHQRVLPGWNLQLEIEGGEHHARLSWPGSPALMYFRGFAPTIEAAYLLAILKAIRAKMEASS